MGTLKRRIIEKMEPKEEPPMGTYIAKCDICGTENTVASYGDWACRQCLQGYTYDECHQIRLTDAQWAMLRNPPRWIPVSERLPKPGQQVLMFYQATDADGTPSCIGCDGNGGLITTATFEQIEGQTLWTSEYGDETPSRWMPLPEPPPIARDVLREQWEKLHKGPRPMPEVN